MARPGGEARTLLAWARARPRPDLGGDLGIERLTALASRWCDDAVDLDCLWLEWDDPRSGSATDRSPGFFTTIPASPDGLTSLLETLGYTAAATISNFVGSLPEAGATGLQVGFFPGRHPQAVRVFARLTGDGRHLLAGLRWPGPADAAEWALSLGAGCDGVRVDLDLVHGRLAPRIGWEFAFAHDAQPAVEPRWRDLTDSLVAAGLAIREQADALLSWPGLRRESVLTREWVECGLSHVKVTVGHGLQARAKAYVGGYSLGSHGA